MSQALTYLGYVKRHGIMMLIVLFSNGFAGCLFGHISGNVNNIASLTITWLNIQPYSFMIMPYKQLQMNENAALAEKY